MVSDCVYKTIAVSLCVVFANYYWLASLTEILLLELSESGCHSSSSLGIVDCV